MSNLKINNPSIVNGVLKFSVILDTVSADNFGITFKFNPSLIDLSPGAVTIPAVYNDKDELVSDEIINPTYIRTPLAGIAVANYGKISSGELSFGWFTAGSKPAVKATVLNVDLKLASSSITSLDIFSTSNYGSVSAETEAVTLSNGSITVIDVGVPVLTSGAALAYTENASATIIDNTITVSDGDDTQ